MRVSNNHPHSEIARSQREVKRNSEPVWIESALAAWLVAAAAFVFSSYCLASLTWDGSYFLLHTLQDGTPCMPALRWCHWILEEPLLLLQPVLNDPVKLAVVHGLTCSLLPLFSLGACLGMLRGNCANLRIWPVIGILLVPLPGQLFLITEVTPTIQLAWILFVFIWLGCPPRWSPVVAVAMLAMATLHPAAAPLFFLAAIMAAAFGFAKEARIRRRMIAWGIFFAAASLAKLAQSVIFATEYERASMSWMVWTMEMQTGLRFTPFPALVPVLIDTGLYAWGMISPQTRLRPPWLSKTLWAAAFVLGGLYAFDTGGWTAGINYRKFVIVVTVPVVLIASIDAWRLRRNAEENSLPSPQARIAPIYAAILFAFIFSGMAFSWKSLSASLMTQLAAHPGAVMTHVDLPGKEQDSALNHWSTTSLSLVLQGWKPEKVFIWDARIQLPANRFCICPGDDFPRKNGSFDLAWLSGTAFTPPPANEGPSLK